MNALKFDPMSQKEVFQDTIGMFHNLYTPSTPLAVEKTLQGTPQTPSQPTSVKSPRVDEYSGKYDQLVNLWLRLLSDILEDTQLTGKMCNTLKTVIGPEESLGEDIFSIFPNDGPTV